MTMPMLRPAGYMSVDPEISKVLISAPISRFFRGAFTIVHPYPYRSKLTPKTWLISTVLSIPAIVCPVALGRMDLLMLTAPMPNSALPVDIPL